MINHINPDHLGAAIDEHAIVSLTDATGNILYANQKFADMSGYTQAELLGNNHRMLKSGIHPAEFYRQLWQTLLNKMTWHGDVCNRRKDGQFYWVHASIMPIIGGSGLPVSFLSIRTDITALKQAELSLQEANAMLEQYRQGSEADLDVARELMEQMIENTSTQVENVEVWVNPAATLSGDLVVTHNYCDERSYVLLADAMGHGLPAALSLIPITQTFSKMAKDGFTISAIIRAMNEAITEFLPVGRFVAVTLLSVDWHNRNAYVWNGGNPPAVLVNGAGKIMKKFISHHLALGVLRGRDIDSTMESFHWGEDCCLTLYSDGLVDAQDLRGEEFGDDRVTAILQGDASHRVLKDSVLTHLGGRDAGDDISVATIRLKGDFAASSVSSV